MHKAVCAEEALAQLTKVKLMCLKFSHTVKLSNNFYPPMNQPTVFVQGHFDRASIYESLIIVTSALQLKKTKKNYERKRRRGNVDQRFSPMLSLHPVSSTD